MIQAVITLEALCAMEPDEAAATLVVRELEGAGELDAGLLAAWLAQDRRHVRAWENTQRAWNAFGDELDQNFIESLKTVAPRAAHARRWPRLAAIAAVTVVAVGLSSLAFIAPWRPRDFGPAATEVASVAYSAPAGLPSSYILPDGSRMVLEGGARLERRFTPGRRDLRLLAGRAYFEVAKNRQRPFVVEAGNQLVTATGTQFDVTLAPGMVRVVLAEGHVIVAGRNGATSVPLDPGQQFEQAGTAAPIVATVDTAQRLEWRDGFVRFDNVPLSQALQELNRGSVDQVVANDPRVASLRINGRFRTGDAVRFARSITGIHPLRVVETGPHQFELVSSRRR